MLLSALLLAAAVQAAPVPPALSDQIGPGQARFYSSKRQAVEAIDRPQACQAVGVELAVNLRPAAEATVRKLGDLPPANHTMAVLRSIDGCPVSSTVRYNVDEPAGR